MPTRRDRIGMSVDEVVTAFQPSTQIQGLEVADVLRGFGAEALRQPLTIEQIVSEFRTSVVPESTIPIEDELVSPAQILSAADVVDMLKNKDPKNAIDVAQNLVVGLAGVVADLPAFAAGLATEPDTTIKGALTGAVETTKGTRNALRWIGINQIGLDEYNRLQRKEFDTRSPIAQAFIEGSVPFAGGDLTTPSEDVTKEDMEKWRADLQNLLVNPEDPIVLVLMATGLVRGTGKAVNWSRHKLIERGYTGKLKGSQIGVNPDFARRLENIDVLDNRVRSYYEKGTPLPLENITEGMLRRSAERNNVGKTEPDFIINAGRLVDAARQDGVFEGMRPSSVELGGARKIKDQVDALKAKTDKSIDEIYLQQDLNRKAILEAEKLTVEKVKGKLVQGFIDAAGNVKIALNKMGDLGSRAAMLHDLAAGSSGKADLAFRSAVDRIDKAVEAADPQPGVKQSFKIYRKPGLNAREWDQLGDHLKSERIVELEQIKDGLESGVRVQEMKVSEVLGQLRAARKRGDKKAVSLHKKQLDLSRAELKKLADDGRRNIQHDMTRNEAELHMENQIDKWGDKATRRVHAAAEEYHKLMREELDGMLRDGLIDKELYDKLKVNVKYNPRQFLQDLDAEQTFDVGSGKKFTTTKSGIEKLKEGSNELIETNPQLLLAQTIMRNRGIADRNAANLALLDLARRNPDNGLVRVADVNAKPEIGWTRMGLREKGKELHLDVKNPYAQEWLGFDPIMTRQDAAIAQTVSGTRVLKLMATQANPEFAFRNLPRDIAHIWLSTNEYSTFGLKYLNEIGADIRRVSKDARTKTGRWEEYVNEGGGMEFLAPQSTKLKTSQMRGWHKGVQVIGDIAAKLGNYSETVTRLALRDRAIANGKTPLEATWIARNYMDFSQGGRYAKAMDNFFPYLNAGIVGTRGVFRGAKNNPVAFGVKSGQIIGLSASLYYLNRMADPEFVNQLTDSEKARNWNIKLPDFFKHEDQSGNTKWRYIAIPKDQGQRTFAAMGEALAQRWLDGTVPSKMMMKAFADFTPVPSTPFTPMGDVFATYFADMDFWTDRRIWGERFRPNLPQDEVYPTTSPFWRDVGRLSDELANIGVGEDEDRRRGISPARAQAAAKKLFTYGNVWTDMAGLGYNALSDIISPEEREAISSDIMRRIPVGRSFIHSTNPRAALREKFDLIAENVGSELLIQDQTTDRFFRADDRKGFLEYKRSLLPEDRSRVGNRWESRRKTTGLPAHVFALEVTRDPQTKARKYFETWVGLDEKSRDELRGQGRKLGWFNSAKFNVKLNRIKRAYKQMLKEEDKSGEEE